MALFSLLHISCSVLLPLTHLSGAWCQQAFRTQPTNVTVKVGASVVLRCEVLRPSGVVQWVKDGFLLGPQRSLPGFPRYSMIGNEKRGQYHLQILNVGLEDDSSYECQAGQSENNRAIVSHTVWITVLIPPSSPIIEAETTEPWVAGEEYTVTCIAPDAKPAAEVTLFKNGVELTESESVPMTGSQEKLQSTEAVVRFTAQSSDDGRRLVCRAKNPALTKALETSLVMNVYFPPQELVIEGLESDEVKAGTTLNLVCVSRGGNPLATLHWTKNNEVLSTSWEVDTVSRKASSSLILQVKPEDNHAVLHCEGVNQVSPRPLNITRMLTVLFEPEEVKLRGSSRAMEGKEVTLSCNTSSSNPPVQIRWWLGFRELNKSMDILSKGLHMGMTTMSNLTYRVSREENGLPIICEAFNSGTRFSKTQSSTLQVFYPPQKVWMDGPPEGALLRSGTTIRLVCFSSGGNPTGRLTWLKDGKPVEAQMQLPSEKGVSRELILVLQPSDNLATYRCEATNEAKKVRFAQTRLHVHFPAINVKIVAKQQEVKRGQSLTMECISGSSNPKANISWSLGPQKLRGVDQAPKKAAYGGVSLRSVLTLTLSSQHNGRRITCQAFSDLLSEGVSTFYKLNVLFPPEFGPDQPKLVQVVEDDKANLQLVVSANPEDITCVWTYQGEKLVKEGGLRYHWKGDQGLEIWNVTRREAGNYTIHCRNSEGENRTAVTLDVQYAPSVRIVTDPVYVDVGQTADLECEADANPVIPGMFSWEWLGEEREDQGSQTTDGATGWLTLHGATRSHAGRYRCTVDNGVAPPASAEVQLVVRFMPELQKGPQWSKVASRGDGSSMAEVVCQAEGIPKVSFVWKKNGVTMDFSNPRYSERTVREGWLHTSWVTIVNVSAALDYAVFTCTAQNALGEDQLDITLLSTNHPDPPSGLKLAEVTPTTVTLDWKEGFDGGLEQRFRVRYRWAASASFLYVDVFPPRATVFTVRGLSPGTAYNFSVNALNAMGESEYADKGAVLTVTTAVLQRPEEEPSPEDDEVTKGFFSTPLYLVVTLVMVGGVLVILNSLGCFVGLRWRKRRSPAEGKSNGSEGKNGEREGSVFSEPNRYERAELINAAARRTLLLDSSSEPESSLYESCREGSLNHYYYPTGDFLPSLYPHSEENDGGYTAHDYEEVRDWGLYEDLGGSLPPLPSLYYPGPQERHEHWDSHDTVTQGAYKRRVGGAIDLERPGRVYDTVTDSTFPRSDFNMPFDLRGELV